MEKILTMETDEVIKLVDNIYKVSYFRFSSSLDILLLSTKIENHKNTDSPTLWFLFSF